MFLVIGLGNPGKEYEKTRHNVGFMVLDMLEKSSLLPNVRLLKPKTYMNNSGLAVKREVKNLKLKIENLIVIHDDIDIPLGKIKVAKDRGSAGHKGVESIIQSMGTKNFTRIRIGIQPDKGKPEDVEKFVLQPFKKSELPLLQTAIKEATQSLSSFVEK